MILSSELAFAGAAGIVSHVAFFMRGEHDEETPSLIQGFLLSFVLLIIVYTGDGIHQAIFNSTLILVVYCSMVWASMVIYRLFFHRLMRFPGPCLARVSKSWQLLRNHKSPNYLQTDNLRLRYGDFVRTGPNELVVFAPEALTALHGPNSRCIKSVWYASMRPEISIHTARNKDDHDRRRRVWDHAFNNTALRAYQSRISDSARQLDAKLADFHGGAVNVTSLFYLYAFDTMGRISYGKSFDLIKTGKQASGAAIEMLREGLSTVGFLIPVPWCFMAMKQFPFIGQKWRRMITWAADQVDQRMKRNTKDLDVMSWLIQDFHKSPGTEQDRLWLNGDAFTVIVAGSGTVASSLTMIFYHLAKHPEHAEKIRNELKTVKAYEDTDLQPLKHLNAVITETIRLFPGVPAGAPRDTPPEGLNIAGRHIPGGVSVIVPCYSLGRLESCFVKADQFIPERWYLKPEMVKEPSANKPFLLGRYGCVGKNLALMQLRGVVALILERYDVSFAPGEDGQSVITHMRDAFNLKPGRLNLTFTSIC